MQAMEILSLRCHLSLWAIWLRVQGCLDWMKDSCISQHSPPGPQGLWLRKAEEFLNMPCSSPYLGPAWRVMDETDTGGAGEGAGAGGGAVTSLTEKVILVSAGGKRLERG